MQLLIVGRFVLVHALIAGMPSTGFSLWLAAAPTAQSGVPPTGEVKPDTIQPMDVFADPNASKTTQAELPVSLGLMASLSANVAIQSVGDPSGGGGFRGYVGGAGVAKRVPPATTVTVTIRPPGPPHPPQILIPDSCVVEVCCTGAGSASSPAWHCFTKCTKTFPDGRTEVIACRGGPSGLLRDLWPTGVPSAPNAPPPCDGWTILDGAWGPIDTYCGPYQRGIPIGGNLRCPARM